MIESLQEFLIFDFRPCGISLGHLEAIGAETCTAFQLLLFELFGEFPDKTLLSGIVIDRGTNKFDISSLVSLSRALKFPEGDNIILIEFQLKAYKEVP